MPRESERKVLLRQLHVQREASELLEAVCPREFRSVAQQPQPICAPDCELFSDSDSDLYLMMEGAEVGDSEHDGNAIGPIRRVEGMDSEVPDDLMNVLESRGYSVPRNDFLQNRAVTIESWFHQPLLENRRVFRSVFRMDRRSFEALVCAIETHPVFSPEITGRCQRPVPYQVAVFLYKLGGAGGTQTQSGLSLGIGDGTIPLYIRRVLKALLSMKDNFIRWHTFEEKNQHKQRVCSATMGVFQGCI